MTTKEKETSIGLHLFDWKLCHKSWGDEHLSTRHSEITPADKTLALAEWAGTKIEQVAILPPQHPAGKKSDELQEPRTWKYSHIGLLHLDEHGKGEDNRSRSVIQKEKR